MSELKFRWHGSAALADEVKRPLSQVSLELDPHRRPLRSTLWGFDGVGLRVQSEMHDLDDRIEIGVLSFDLVSAPTDGERIVDLGSNFRRVAQAMKLVVSELGHRAESGLLLQSETGREILIVAGAHPYHLAVEGFISCPKFFESEYPLNRYERVELS